MVSILQTKTNVLGTEEKSVPYSDPIIQSLQTITIVKVHVIKL